MVYYNEIDLRAAQWLRNLIDARLIPQGVVDTRSIVEVRPHEVANFTQRHWFAGIGGWALALRMAQWPDSRPVQTGSCPCQPFSDAGNGKGTADARHLWPFFRDHITFGEPTVTFGEQVASKLGRAWFSDVRSDMEGIGYEVGAADLCAASIGAPHARQRLFFVANPKGKRGRGWKPVEAWNCEEPRGSGSDFCPHSWPDGYGGGSALSVSDVLSPSYGVPGRVGLLRGYGNAIVPQVAAEFIKAFMSL